MLRLPPTAVARSKVHSQEASDEERWVPGACDPECSTEPTAQCSASRAHTDGQSRPIHRQPFRTALCSQCDIHNTQSPCHAMSSSVHVPTAIQTNPMNGRWRCDDQSRSITQARDSTSALSRANLPGASRSKHEPLSCHHCAHGHGRALQSPADVD